MRKSKSQNLIFFSTWAQFEDRVQLFVDLVYKRLFSSRPLQRKPNLTAIRWDHTKTHLEFSRLRWTDLALSQISVFGSGEKPESQPMPGCDRHGIAVSPLLSQTGSSCEVARSPPCHRDMQQLHSFSRILSSSNEKPKNLMHKSTVGIASEVLSSSAKTPKPSRSLQLTQWVFPELLNALPCKSLLATTYLHAYSHRSESGRQKSHLASLATRYSSNNGPYRFRYSVHSNDRKIIPERRFAKFENLIFFYTSPHIRSPLHGWSSWYSLASCRSSDKMTEIFRAINMLRWIHSARLLGWWASINRTGWHIAGVFQLTSCGKFDTLLD